LAAIAKNILHQINIRQNKMRTLIKVIIPILIFTSCGGNKQTDTFNPISKIGNDKTVKIDSIFSQYNQNTPGYAVAIVQNGEVVKMKHIPQTANYWQMWNATRDFAEELWGKCNTSNDYYHYVMQAWYYIDVQLGSGCAKVSTEAIEEKNKSYVYYNSIDKTLSIYSNENVVFLSIYDLNGKTVMKKTDGNKAVDVSDLSNGVYIISVKTDKSINNSKIIIVN
jgi:hypothetical protein